jgi:hypothetical protein
VDIPEAGVSPEQQRRGARSQVARNVHRLWDSKFQRFKHSKLQGFNFVESLKAFDQGHYPETESLKLKMRIAEFWKAKGDAPRR